MKETYNYQKVIFQYELYIPMQEEALMPLVVYLPQDEKDNCWKVFTSNQVQSRHPCYVLCLEYKDWTESNASQALQRLIFEIRFKKNMDICRTYLVGCGVGAVCAWHMLGSYPRVFAGTIAVGGCGDPYHARNAVYAPVWAFHSLKDKKINYKLPSIVFNKVFLAGSKRLHDALCTAGGKQSKYTEIDCDANELPDFVLSDPAIIDWLFNQDRKKITWITMITPELYRFDDWFMSSCYLIIGRDRALLVDTTMTHEKILPLIQKITTLPVDLAITHPHLDHMMHAYAFDNVYIIDKAASNMEKHLQIMKQMLSGELAGAGFIHTDMVPSYIDEAMKLKNVVPLQDGSVIDLGGNVRIEAKYIGGHTWMDLVFVDHYHHNVFTGDAVGSGYVVGVNYVDGKFDKTYTEYRNALIKFLDYIKDKGEYTYYGGHFIQENSCDDPKQEDYLNNQSTYFVPLTIDVIQDMVQICNGLLNGKYNEEIDENGGFFVRYGDAALAATRLPENR